MIEDLRSFAGRHSGQPAAIFGAGPSLAWVTPADVEGFALVAVNSGCLKLPERNDYYFSCDANVTVCSHWPALAAQWCELFLTPSSCHTPGRCEAAGIDLSRVHWLEKRPTREDRSLATTERLIFGTSGAHCATHLALVMGCSPVVLFGCGCDISGPVRYTDLPDQPSETVIDGEPTWMEQVRRRRADLTWSRGAYMAIRNEWRHIAAANPEAPILDASGKLGYFPAVTREEIRALGH